MKFFMICAALVTSVNSKSKKITGIPSGCLPVKMDLSVNGFLRVAAVISTPGSESRNNGTTARIMAKVASIRAEVARIKVMVARIRVEVARIKVMVARIRVEVARIKVKVARIRAKVVRVRAKVGARNIGLMVIVAVKSVDMTAAVTGSQTVLSSIFSPWRISPCFRGGGSQ